MKKIILDGERNIILIMFLVCIQLHGLWINIKRYLLKIAKDITKNCEGIFRRWKKRFSGWKRMDQEGWWKETLFVIRRSEPYAIKDPINGEWLIKTLKMQHYSILVTANLRDVEKEPLEISKEFF